jgi:hypothetical protein
MDFDSVPWIDHSARPLTFEDLRPFYDRARLRLGVLNRATDRREPISDDVDLVPTLHSSVRFEGFGKAELLPNQAVVRLNQQGTAIESAEVVGPDARPHLVRSRLFVLAAGGIGTPRLLIHSRLGKDLAGRFFADHPYLTLPLPNIDSLPPVEAIHRPGFAFSARLGLSAAGHSKARAPGVSGYLRRQRVPLSWNRPGVRAVRDLSAIVQNRELPSGLGATLGRAALGLPGAAMSLATRKRRTLGLGLRIALEPSPDPDSRVTLSDRRDELGVPLPRVEWRLSRAALGALHRYLEALGDVDPGWRPPSAAADVWPTEVEHGAHHMGTRECTATIPEGSSTPTVGCMASTTWSSPEARYS